LVVVGEDKRDERGGQVSYTRIPPDKERPVALAIRGTLSVFRVKYRLFKDGPP